MKAFRRPALFENWLELASWLAVPGAVAAGSVLAAREPMPGPILCIAVLLGLSWILFRKFGPRVADLHRFAFRTVQGVGVVYRDGATEIPRIAIETAIQRAIQAHGHGGALDGYGMLILSGRLYAGPVRCHGVTDGGWIQVTWDGGMTLLQMTGLITHETSHALLFAAGVPEPEHHARMIAAGTI